MSFFETWLSREMDFNEEVINLERLFKMDWVGYSSLNARVSSNFLTWRHRNNTISLDEFKKKSGIGLIIKKVEKNELNKLEDFLFYLEYYITILKDFDVYFDHNMSSMRAISENIKNILEKINFKVIWIGGYGKGYCRIVEKDFKSREAAEQVDENLAEKIYMYHHYSNKGNLYEKAIILSRLYMCFEEIGKNLKANNYGDLVDIVNNLSDKLNVRHKPNQKEELVIQGFTNEELEKAYDTLFDTYLSGIVLQNHIKQKPYLKSICKKFNEKGTK